MEGNLVGRDQIIPAVAFWGTLIPALFITETAMMKSSLLGLVITKDKFLETLCCIWVPSSWKVTVTIYAMITPLGARGGAQDMLIRLLPISIQVTFLGGLGTIKWDNQYWDKSSNII